MWLKNRNTTTFWKGGAKNEDLATPLIFLYIHITFRHLGSKIETLYIHVGLACGSKLETLYIHVRTTSGSKIETLYIHVGLACGSKLETTFIHLLAYSFHTNS